MYMPRDCCPLVVGGKSRGVIGTTTSVLEREGWRNRLEVVSQESQMGSFIVTLKRADSTI